MQSDSLLSKNINLNKTQIPQETKELQEQAPAFHTTERFIEELTRVNGQLIRTSKNDVTDKVIEFLKSRNNARIHLEPNVLDEVALQNAGITVGYERDSAVGVGVTKAICGLADTGSVGLTQRLWGIPWALE